MTMEAPMHNARPERQPRRLLLSAALAFLLLASASPVLADQSNHTTQLPLWLTPTGEAAGHPTLRAGQVVNIHANGPVVFAIENYLLNGAKPMTSYAVVLGFNVGSCGGAFAFPFPNGATLTTDASGNAHGQARVTPEQVASFGLHDTDWGIVWTFVDGDGVAAYSTTCTDVHID
jgi:hypothetical protein